MTPQALEAARDRLLEALRWEHAGIVQAMHHAFRLNDLATLHVIEGIARQDMRHYKWLAEMVVRLGGEPTMARAPVSFEQAAATIWLAKDVSLVEDAIARYRAHLDVLGGADPDEPGIHQDLVRLLIRILGDKEDHRERLHGLLDDWRQRGPAVGPADEVAPESSEAEAVRGFLSFAVGHEYEVILQYLHHAFMLEDQGVSRQLEEIAIEEMRHLGWLSEMLVARGGCPYWDAKRVERHDDPIVMLELDQAREIEVEADYQQMMMAMKDAGVRRLFDRIGSHEKFHAGTIGHLIDTLKAAKSRPEAMPAPEAPAPSPSRCPFTVGSLLGT